jgi:hypothetical protein
MTVEEAEQTVAAGEPNPYDPYDWELYIAALRLLGRQLPWWARKSEENHP